MKRRQFLKRSSIAALGASIFSPLEIFSQNQHTSNSLKKPAKNIIFLVSDGMSIGTLTITDLFLQRKEGKKSEWLALYGEKSIVRSLMDTSSSDSLVTDSAAASSSWGGGKRVPNGSLNINADGSSNTPILQKFKKAGKAVGCITTVPITHATPAGFCVATQSRNSQESIANQYSTLDFDVMLGGGNKYFDKTKRKDGNDVYEVFKNKGYEISFTRDQILSSNKEKALLGVFADDALPYYLDGMNDKTLKQNIPTLAEMSQIAIEKLSRNENGFVLQVEGGKVDWAAHANDISALIYEQIEFDNAIKTAIDFAEKNKDTLVIITTDHGNANPGLFKTKNNDQSFEKLFNFKKSNDWILNGIHKNNTPQQVIERIEYATGIAVKAEEASEILQSYKNLQETGVYNYNHLPFKYLSSLISVHTSTGFGSMDHSADYVELTMYGPGSELLPPFIQNYELHDLMLNATQVKS